MRCAVCGQRFSIPGAKLPPTMHKDSVFTCGEDCMFRLLREPDKYIKR